MEGERQWRVGLYYTSYLSITVDMYIVINTDLFRMHMHVLVSGECAWHVMACVVVTRLWGVGLEVLT